MSWHAVWNRKSAGVSSLTLPELIAADGFDTGAGAFSEHRWCELVDFAARKLQITPGAHVMEVGCGAGAFLLPLYEQGYAVSGVDYSQAQIDVCQRVMPEGEFYCREALELPFGGRTFAGVICHSVLQYFPDHDYARRAVTEMLRVVAPGGRVLILDVNDEEKAVEFEELRRGNLGAEEYQRRYAGLPHLYYRRDWFLELGRDSGAEVDVFDRVIDGYGNSMYRYNVALAKPART